MTTQYLHGVETLEISDGIRPVRRVRTSVIGLVGTAPGADAEKFPLNRPVAIPGNTLLANALGQTGTLPDAMKAIYNQIGAFVVVVRVEPGQNGNETLARVCGDPVAKTGVWALLSSASLTQLTPKILIAPGFTSERPATGIKEVQVTSGGGPYTEAPDIAIVPGVNGGSGAKVRAVIQGGAVTQVIVESPGIGYGASVTATITAKGNDAANEDFEAATITIVRGTTANPVAASLVGVADRLRAIALVDGPNTNNEDAIAYREDFGSARLNIIDPMPLVFDTTEETNVSKPAAAFAAGIQAKMDNDRGFWWSYSNQAINGVVGVSRPIAANLSDPNSEHNWLNENCITTIIRDDGFRFFGLRSCSDDPQQAFLSVRRVIDVVRDEVEKSFTWAVDRPFSQQLVREIIESMNAYLRTLKAEGAIVGGRCWLNPDFNPYTNLMDGKLTLDFDIEPVAPIERLTFRIHRNPEYYTDAIEEIVRALAA